VFAGGEDGGSKTRLYARLLQVTAAVAFILSNKVTEIAKAIQFEI
jgi:hypothetical protein